MGHLSTHEIDQMSMEQMLRRLEEMRKSSTSYGLSRLWEGHLPIQVNSNKPEGALQDSSPVSTKRGRSRADIWQGYAICVVCQRNCVYVRR